MKHRTGRSLPGRPAGQRRAPGWTLSARFATTWLSKKAGRITSGPLSPACFNVAGLQSRTVPSILVRHTNRNRSGLSPRPAFLVSGQARLPLSPRSSGYTTVICGYSPAGEDGHSDDSNKVAEAYLCPFYRAREKSHTQNMCRDQRVIQRSANALNRYFFAHAKRSDKILFLCHKSTFRSRAGGSGRLRAPTTGGFSRWLFFSDSRPSSSTPHGRLSREDTTFRAPASRRCIRPDYSARTAWPGSARTARPGFPPSFLFPPRC